MRPQLLAVPARHLGREKHVVDDRSPGQEHMILENDAHAGWGILRDVAKDGNLAGAGMRKSRNQPHHRRFSAARRTDNRHELPIANRQIEFFKRHNRRMRMPEIFADAL
ncbi:hypothetical protein D3C87_969540 [compost metagenome]